MLNSGREFSQPHRQWVASDVDWDACQLCLVTVAEDVQTPEVEVKLTLRRCMETVYGTLKLGEE